jgi:selenide,water dikinase
VPKRLTAMVRRHGCSCKVRQDDLERLLESAGLISPDELCDGQIGDDAVVRKISEEVAIIENVDIFTPIHDDPEIQGAIVACNASNDVFAMGSTHLLSLQAFLAIPPDLPEEISVGVLRGMDSFMKKFGSGVTGGQSISNPEPVFGGICLGLVHPNDIVYSRYAKPGDSVLLTKPLGIQPAMRSYRDLQDEKRDKLLENFDEPSLKRMQDNAVRIMTQSNLEVAQAMKDIGVHAATDVTGFGLVGHAENVASMSCVNIIFDTMPIISGTNELADFFGHKLASGRAAETAGGMLVFLESSKVSDFIEYLQERHLPCWPVGTVEKSNGFSSVTLTEDIEYIQTDFP